MSGFQYHWQHLVFSIKKVFCALLAKVTYFAFYYVHTGFFPKKCFINAQQIEKSKSKWWCWRTGQKRGKSFIQDFLEFSKHKKSTYITYILQKKKEMARHFFLVNMKSYVVSAFSFCTPPTVSEKGVPTNPWMKKYKPNFSLFENSFSNWYSKTKLEKKSSIHTDTFMKWRKKHLGEPKKSFWS